MLVSALDFFARRPRLAAAGVLVAVLVALPLLARLEVDNSIEAWIDRSEESFLTYQRFLDEFGSEEYLLVVYEAPAELNDDFLFELTDLRFELEQIDGVRFAIDLSSLRGKLAGPAATDFASDVRSSPFYRGFLISDDGAHLATWLMLDLPSPSARIPLVGAVESVVRQRWPDRDVRLAGTPAISAALDHSSRRSARTLFPFVFLVSGAMLVYHYRRLLTVVVPLVSVGSGIVVTLALLERFGGTIDMISSTLPSVLWILGLSTSVHLLSCRRRLLAAGVEPEAAALEAMREVARPCQFSALTTSLGFLAVASSAMQPVRQVGVFAALGILICLATNFLLFPALSILDGRRATLTTARSWPVRVGHLALARPATILAIAGLATVLLVVSMGRIRAESNVVSFLKPETSIATTYRDVLPGLTGPFSLELLVDPPGEVDTLETFHELERLEAVVAETPGIVKALSPVGLVKQIHRVTAGEGSWELPPDEESFSLAWQRTSTSFDTELATLYDEESGTVRISLLASPMDSGAHRRLVSELRSRLATEAREEWRPRLTGIVDLLVSMHTELVRSQVRSFLLAFVLIGPMIALLLRSPRYALLSLPPNLFPVLVALGTMGAVGIRLDPATVMIAAMALGIAVDDTIHFLTRYRTERERAGRLEALDRTFSAVADPIAETSMVAAAGFLVLLLSDFVPLIYFGLLTALALAAALVADLLVLPALLVAIDRRNT